MQCDAMHSIKSNQIKSTSASARNCEAHITQLLLFATGSPALTDAGATGEFVSLTFPHRERGERKSPGEKKKKKKKNQI
jgi:hypothetical protein